MMTMNTGMSHSCPVVIPTLTDPPDGLFEGAAVFIMPSGDMGSWTMEVTVHNHANGIESSTNIPVVVSSPADSRVYSFQSPVDQSMIFLTMIEPSKPEVGMNDFIVGAYYRESMTSFPPLENLKISFEPEMPSMGHGSPNNVNPVYTADGQYKGTVNFTMDGWWRLNMTISDQSDAVLDDSHYFDVNF